MEITSRDRILIIAPHPDDEILSSFKIISDGSKTGAKVKIVFLTNGERNYLAYIYQKKKVPLSKSSRKAYALERRYEALKVLSNIGKIQSEFLEFRDLKVENFLNEIINCLNFLIKDFSPTIIIAPSPLDLHPDHNVVAMLTEIVVRSIKVDKPPLLFQYCIHPSEISILENFEIKLELSPLEKRQKEELLSLYSSQKISIKKVLPYFLSKEYFTSTTCFRDLHLEAVFSGDNYVWFKTDLNGYLLPVYVKAFYTDGIICKQINFRLNLNKISVMNDRLPSNDINPVRLQKFLKTSGGFIAFPEKLSSGLKFFGAKLTTLAALYNTTGIIKPIPKNLTPPEKGKCCVVIPCYNIEEFCGKVVKEAAEKSDFVVAIDDGSKDNTFTKLEEVRKTSNNVRIIKFAENRGKGFALLEGIRVAIKEIEADLVLTMDGDMQHRADDIARFYRAWREGGEFIIGYRNFSGNVPFRSYIGNLLINFLVRFFLNRALIDSQSGFRGFSRKAAESIISSPFVRSGRYETEIDILFEVLNNNFRLVQVEIPTIYLDGNKKSSFRPFFDSFRIFKTFLFNIFRFKLKRKNLNNFI